MEVLLCKKYLLEYYFYFFTSELTGLICCHSLWAICAVVITIYAAPYADEAVLYLLLIISACMVIYTLYCIYQAVRDSEQQVGELGAPRLKTWWIIYITLALLAEIFRFIPLSQAIVNVLSIILAFGGMVTLIAYSVVLYQTMNLYKNREIMLTAQAESNENPTDNF